MLVRVVQDPLGLQLGRVGAVGMPYDMLSLQGNMDDLLRLVQRERPTCQGQGQAPVRQ